MASPAFDDVKLREVRTTMDRIWGDAQARKNYTAKVDSLNAIINKQTASVNMLNSNVNKDQDVSVTWVKLGDETVNTFDPILVGPAVCDIDGPELQADAKPYQLTIGTEKTFKIEETGSAWGEGLRGVDLTFEQLVAQGLLQTRKALVEDANKRVLAKLDTFTGTNLYNGEYSDDATTPTGDTIIPAADFGAYNVLPYLAAVQDLNRYQDAYILDGGLLYRDMFMAGMGAKAADSIEINRLFGQFDITEDLYNFSKAALADRLYMVDKSAVAFVSKNHYTTTPVEKGYATYRYAMPLPELGNNVMADVVYQFKCIDDKDYHVYKLALRYDLLLNPTIGDVGLTGVLAFRKGAAA